MTSNLPDPANRLQPAGSTPSIWLHRYAVFVAVCTALLVFAGGLVTSTGAGLSVPDWPLSYGMLMPPMVGNVRFEHGHRMVATTVGMLTIVLAVWLQRREPRAQVRRLGWLALGAVVLQGLLGGLTVLLLLPTPVSVAHASLGQTFFCIVVSLALLTSPGWRRATPRSGGASQLRKLALLLTAVVYVQLIAGALMRHSGAGLAIPDFPLAFGRVVPPFESTEVMVHFAHRVLAACVFVAAVATGIHALRHHRGERRLLAPALLLFYLVLIQIVLGGFAIWTQKAVVPTTLHVLNGALILATSLVLTLRSFRLLQPQAHIRQLEPQLREQVVT
ncbi:MAG: heme A synthase [Candidatus Latescibacterota bacterium]|nr:MAG: heme A synthase [Candidatus Latescibacterota bacterium]